MRTRNVAAIPPQDGLQGRHVLMSLLAFFGVIFTVNGYFLVSALSTHTGVVSIEPYRKGLQYNARINAAERQTELGWREALSADASGRVALALHDAQGLPVQNLKVAATIGRPATERFDRHLVLMEREPGHYTASASSLDAGAWIASIEARTTGAGQPIYQVRRRLWLKQ